MWGAATWMAMNFFLNNTPRQVCAPGNAEDSVSVPVYQEVVIGARHRQPFLVFNLNTVLLIIVIVLLFILIDAYLSDNTHEILI